MDMYAVLHRLSDTEGYKEYSLHIQHPGATCVEGKPCYGDWRRDVCNRNTY